MGHKKSMFRELCRVCTDAGATDVSVLFGRVHPKIAGQYRGRGFAIVVAGTPSDSRRGMANTIARIKREFREIDRAEGS